MIRNIIKYSIGLPFMVFTTVLVLALYPIQWVIFHDYHTFNEWMYNIKEMWRLK
jgi:hypothetical protein